MHGTNYVVPPARCPRLVTVYDCWFLDHPADALPDVRRAAAVLRRAVADGAHVVTSSDATSRRVRELLGTDRVRTILLGPPPIDRRRRPHRSPAGLPDLTSAPFILAVGTLERRKNLPTLVAAFGRLAREHPNVKLVMAGAVGNDADAVNRGIARLDPAIAERVIRTGPVDDHHEALAAATCSGLGVPVARRGLRFPDPRSAACSAPRSWPAPPVRSPRSPVPRRS